EKLFDQWIEGRVLQRYPKVNLAKEEVLFEIRNLTSESGSIEDINITVRKGEIVGVTGLYGAGKTSIGNTLYGLEHYKSGEVFLNGETIQIGSSEECIKNGIGYIHENIKGSLVQNQSVSDNIILANLKKFKSQFQLNKAIKEKTYPYIESLNLKKIRNYQSVSSYSVGSQQKIVFAKWLFADSHLVIIDEPTKNVDVISKIELYNLMTHMVKKGKGILLLSSDVDELIGMCDTLLIMYEGKIVKKLVAKNTTHKEILYYSMGKGNVTK
ncbi:MAG: sugar ABC transporter ATP-binding protein, partial [Vallitaleaceae bacterium]|nr:sugar ABC transporter ATP-binding protein [Vallitaleaceae bacterium]